MAYKKHNFADGNVLHAADLNAMEDQIAANEAAAAKAGGVVSGSVSDSSLTLNNKDGSSAVIQLPQSGGDFSEVERKLKFLYELTRGQAWDYETDSTEAHSKAIPSGARMASVNAIGGRSFKYNQGWNPDENLISLGASVFPVTKYGNIYTGTLNTATACGFQTTYACANILGHKYLCVARILAESDIRTTVYARFGYSKTHTTALADYSAGTWYDLRQIITPIENASTERLYIYVNAQAADDVVGTTFSIDISAGGVFDLTATFGSGSEPTTVEAAIAAYKALGIDITQPQPYSAGEIRHTAVTEVVTRGRNLIDLDNTAIDVYTDFSVEAGKTFTVSCAIGSGTYGFHVRYADGTNEGWYLSVGSTSDGRKYRTVTPTKAITKISRKYGEADQYMVTFGSDILPYAPYRTPITQPIPASVLALDGYGWSVGTASNRIYREGNKWFYKQEVGSVDMGNIGWEMDEPRNYFYYYQNGKKQNSLNLITSKYPTCATMGTSQMSDKQIGASANSTRFFIKDSSYTNGDDLKTALAGEILYYELETPILTDITDYMTNLFDPTEVEAGGSITFESESKAAVPNEVEYLLKLSEVG